jgi:iron complex transport system substrate-binding protein
MLSYFLRLILLFSMVFMLTAGCNYYDHYQTENVADSGDCRLVEHSMGKVCIPQNPQRMIALNPAALGNAIALGLKPIASVFEYDGQPPNHLAGKTNGIESLGEWAQPNIERMALLKPEVMISWQHNHEAIYSHLAAISPTLFYDWIGGNVNIDNWKHYFDFMAEALNRQEARDQVW